MNEMKVAKGLGWFSLGLGLVELVKGEALAEALGMEDKTWLIRGFGVREMAAGAAIFSQTNPKLGMWSRVAGDVLDLAVLASAYKEDNPKRQNVAAAIATVAGITLLDYWCAKRLNSGRPHPSERLHQLYRKPDPAPQAEPGYAAGSSL